MNQLFSDTVDIKNLKLAQKLIDDCKNGFFKLFDSSPVCMSMTTLGNRHYVKVNPKFIEKFGYTEDEMIARTSIEIGILDSEESKKVANLIKEKGKIESEIIKCIAKDGKVVHTISSIEKIEFNNTVYLISSFLDISKVIEQQKIIEEQQQNIFDSLQYARLIQNSILPAKTLVKKLFPQSFILNKPKDIVSGDFYFMREYHHKIFIAVCDCTGHGIPGALISIAGNKLLHRLISENYNYNPAEILNKLNNEITPERQYPNPEMESIKDGMDISLCVIDKAKMIMEYAGAFNPIYHLTKKTINTLKVDRIPVHLFSRSKEKTFTCQCVILEKGDSIYLSTDGYVDQFGGQINKKFTSKRLKELLVSIKELSMEEQKKLLDDTTENWRAQSNEVQTDDILVFGIRI